MLRVTFIPGFAVDLLDFLLRFYLLVPEDGRQGGFGYLLGVVEHLYQDGNTSEMTWFVLLSSLASYSWMIELSLFRFCLFFFSMMTLEWSISLLVCIDNYITFGAALDCLE